MAHHNINKSPRNFCFLLTLVLFLGCEKRPDIAQSEPAHTPPPNESSASESPPESPPRNPSGTSQSHSLDHQPAPIHDIKTSLDRVRARISEKIGSFPPDLSDIEKLHSVWSETWHDSFDAILESASVPDVAEGRILPPEIVRQLDDTVLAAEWSALYKTGIVGDQDEFDAAFGLTLVASYACMGSGAEIPIFLNRAEWLPPTEGDLMVFKAFNLGLMQLERPAILTDAELERWQSLVTARNPVYRLIAARTFNSVSADLAQRSAVYRQLLHDSDPTIARIAITGASRNLTPETAVALGEFRDRQTLLGNTELVSAATSALTRIEESP